MRAYYAVFVPDPDDGKVSVRFPDVPGCVTWGKTMEEAFSQAMEALKGHLEALADIPAPSSRAAAWDAALRDFAADGATSPEGTVLQLVPSPDVAEKSARVNVSFKKSVLFMIDGKAEAAGMTRSGFLARAAEAYPGQE
ncbi:MAG: type II toxin-antitoxin system HicB family antitoxin [Desulfovibrio sp.]|nr:type II toxin-antitoxin system HicB family antitoxin [Desulfovibrio sp.]